MPTTRSLISSRIVRLFRDTSLLTGLLLVPALSVGQVFVQENNNTVSANSASVSVAYAAPETAGNLNLVVVGWNDSSSSVTSVVDDNTNTYVLVGTTAGLGLSQAIYYARNIVLPNNATPTVTVTFNQTAGSPDVRILEYSGLSTTTPLDNWAGSSGVSTSADSGGATTTTSDLILGAGTTVGTFTAAGAGFTSRVITTPFGDIVEDSNTAQASGTYNATAAIVVSDQWVMQVAAFSTTGVSFVNPPIISPVTPITPASGSDVGGTSVTITGTNFQPGAVVLFGTAPGGISGVNCAESGGTTITCLTPADTDGAKDVTVVNVDGQSSSATASYTFQNVTPVISTITPAISPTNGGTATTITGSNFQVGAGVVIGGLPAGNVVVQDSATITANTPGLPLGPADVTVNNPGGGTATKIGGFTYVLGTGPVNYVQSGTAGTASATATTIIGVMSSSQTAGNLNVVIIGWNDTVAAIASVTDTEGNTYVPALPVVTGTALSQVIYYAKNIAGDGGGAPNQITVTFNQAAQSPDVHVLEYRGLDISSPVDAAAASFGSGLLADTGACTTTAAIELVVAGATVSTSVAGAGPGFNLLNITTNGDSAEHQITSVAGSCEATAPLSSTGNWVMQTVTFKVPPAPAPDFSLSTAPNSQTVIAASPASYTISVTPVNGFNSAVTLTCAAVSLPTGTSCAFAPSSVTPGAAAVTSALTITTSATTPVGTSIVTVTGTSGSVSHNTSVGLTINPISPPPDFTIAASALSPATVAAGGSATSTITIAPLNAFNGAVALTCSIAPPATPAPTCALAPTSVANGSGTSGLTVRTTPATTASIARQPTGVFYAMWLPIGGLTLLGTGINSRRKRLLSFLLGCLLFSGLIFLVACGGSSPSGGGGHPGTPAGNYTVTVTGTSGSTTHTSSVTVTVQ